MVGKSKVEEEAPELEGKIQILANVDLDNTSMACSIPITICDLKWFV